MSENPTSDLSGLVITPISKPKPPTPPPSTKRWTWEYVPADDGRDRRKQTTPELDSELLSQGRRTRRMSKAANGTADTPTQQVPRMTSSKVGIKRKAATSEGSDTDTDDDDVVPESVRIAKQRKLRHEGSKLQQQARPTTKAESEGVKAPRLKKAHVVTKPRIKAVRVPRQKKARKDSKPNPNVLRACAIARAARSQKAKRQVRIAQSAVQDMEPAVDIQQEYPDPAYVYNTEPERRHGIMLKKEFYDPFRQAFSLNFIWPSFSSNTVQNALDREREVQSVQKFSIFDIIPKDLRRGIQERMAQHEPANPQDGAIVNQVRKEQATVDISAPNTARQITEALWEDVTDHTIQYPKQSEPRTSDLENLENWSQGGVTGHITEAEMTAATTYQNQDKNGPEPGESDSGDRFITNTDTALEHAKQEGVLTAEERATLERLFKADIEKRLANVQHQSPSLLPNEYSAETQGQGFTQNMAGAQLPTGLQARPQGLEVKQDMAVTQIYGSTDDDTPNSDELDSRASWGPEMDEDEDEDETDEENFRSGRFVIRPQVNGF
ncbi:hypothetical protein N7G274_005430 [Stereocaulon virgatum]|uniref:Uncharacterized protein n=1 Tax=Stereocaulon virgatum TaxID=373712 RepID=A0ABR4A9S4_9LECA